jgi:hypothetical protein
MLLPRRLTRSRVAPCPAPGALPACKPRRRVAPGPAAGLAPRLVARLAPRGAQKLAAAAVALGVCHAEVAAASPADLFGFGSRSQALAGTGASFASGFAASYINPAGLASAPERSLALGLQGAQFDLYTQTDATRTPLRDASQALLLGVTAPLSFRGPLSDRLVLGLGASTPGATIARVRLLDTSEPQFPLLATRSEALNLSLGAGVRLPWGLQLGLGTQLLASLAGSVALDTTGPAARSVTDDELRVVQAPIVGVSYQATPELALGVSARGQLVSEFDLLVTVADLGPIVVPPLHVAGIAQVDPATLALEASYHASGTRWIAGITYQHWPSLKRFKSPTVQCPSEQPDCAAAPGETLNLEGTWVPRAAWEQELPLTRLAKVHLRLGYFFEPSPFPSARLPEQMYDNSSHVQSAGYAVTLSEPVPLSVGLAAQWHLLTDEPFVALASDETPQSDLHAAGQIVNFCLTSEVQF